MPSPTPGSLHVDRYLTNVSVGWLQQQKNFIADQVFPIVPVLKQSDKYAKYKKGFFYRDEVSERPLGERPNRAGYEIESATYYAPELGLAHRIDDRVRANADQPLDPDLAAMRLLTTQMMIHRDKVWANKYFTTKVWGTDLTGKEKEPGAGEFLQFDQSGSTPIELIDEKRDAIAGATGYEPNTLVLGRDVFRVLKNHSTVLDRMKYTQTAVDATTEQILAPLFGVDRVIVAGGVINSANEGATDSIDFIVNKKSMLLVYAAPAPAIDVPSGGYTFTWTGLIPELTNAFGGVISRLRDEGAHSDEIQIRAAYDMEVVASELGIFFSEAVKS